MAPKPHECERADQLDRIEEKLDKALEVVGDLKGRVFAHELLAASAVTVVGLALAAWSVIK